MRAFDRAHRQPASVRDGLADSDQDFRPDHGGDVNPDLAAEPAAHGHGDHNAVPHHTPDGNLIPHAPPTATSAPDSVVLPSVDPVILGTCPAAVHDRYTVVGPDGKTYRTWHPATVPLDPNDPLKGTCTFAHEHGDDPRTLLVNPSLPPFGYIGALAGDNEPHEGFKVFVANRGVVNDEGATPRPARASSRTWAPAARSASTPASIR